MLHQKVILAVGFEPTTVLRRTDSLENAIPLLVYPRLKIQAAIGSASTSIRDHHTIVFGAPLPFRLRERIVIVLNNSAIFFFYDLPKRRRHPSQVFLELNQETQIQFQVAHQ